MGQRERERVEESAEEARVSAGALYELAGIAFVLKKSCVDLLRILRIRQISAGLA